MRFAASVAKSQQEDTKAVGRMHPDAAAPRKPSYSAAGGAASSAITITGFICRNSSIER